MPLRPQELAKTIDHTLLDPQASRADVERVCDEACDRHFASVCVLPRHVPEVTRRLGRRDVKVAALIGPDAALAGECVASGAVELDVVMNVVAMLAGDIRRVRDELAAVVRTVRLEGVTTGKRHVLVKVAIDCHHLDDKHKRLACKIVEHVDADFAAARPRNGASPVDDVELLRDRLPEDIGVKAFGAITTAEEALELVTAGAVRIGTRHAVAIVDASG